MEYSVNNQADGVQVALSGQFTFADNQKFKNILELSNSEGLRSFELNFANVDFIDSAGLGMLLLLRDTCQNKHIPVSISAAQGQVEKIFMISKFDQLFTINM